MSKDQASRKLLLKRETITTLTNDDLEGARGGILPSLAVSAWVTLSIVSASAITPPVVNTLGKGPAKGPPGPGKPPAPNKKK